MPISFCRVFHHSHGWTQHGKVNGPGGQSQTLKRIYYLRVYVRPSFNYKEQLWGYLVVHPARRKTESSQCQLIPIAGCLTSLAQHASHSPDRPSIPVHTLYKVYDVKATLGIYGTIKLLITEAHAVSKAPGLCRLPINQGTLQLSRSWAPFQHVKTYQRRLDIVFKNGLVKKGLSQVLKWATLESSGVYLTGQQPTPRSEKESKY